MEERVLTAVVLGSLGLLTFMFKSILTGVRGIEQRLAIFTTKTEHLEKQVDMNSLELKAVRDRIDHFGDELHPVKMQLALLEQRNENRV